MKGTNFIFGMLTGVSIFTAGLFLGMGIGATLKDNIKEDK
jgi:hypothetical protein